MSDVERVWKVACTWEVYGVGNVSAGSLEEAISIAEEDDFPLPTDPSYVEASFQVDPEVSELLNEGKE